jgi:hypothetical protein
MSARHYSQHQAQARFTRNMQLLELELAMGTPRRHLEVLIELLEQLVKQCGSSLLVDSYRIELDHAKHRVTTRSNLRLVQS